ncbi:MAG: hypothetical protein ACRDWT_06010 [Jatrophihabitantaceae bacterium]
MRRLRVHLCAAAVIVIAGTAAPMPPASSVASGTVYLQTVPALGGVRVSVGSTTVTTASDGSAAVDVAALDGIARSVQVASQYVDANTRIELSKVAVLPHSAAHQSRLGVGLNVFRSVHLLLSSGSSGVAVSAVRSVRLRSVTGSVVSTDPRTARSVSLLSVRTTLVRNVLTAQQVSWYVERISAGPGIAVTTSTPRFDPSTRRTWALPLQTVHGTLEIATVPSTPGALFLIDGAVATTGSDGRASVPIANLNGVDSRLRLATPAAGDLTVSLLRVTRMKPRASFERSVIAALAIRRPVSLRFLDLAGSSVPAGRVSGVRVEGDGSDLQLSGSQVGDAFLLLAEQATRVRNVWQVRRVSYAMSAVRIDGSDVVFAGAQHFEPATAQVWPVRLSVFRVSVTAHDALFGMRVGSHLVITRPDGTRFAEQVSGDGPSTVVSSIARGVYDFHFSAAIFGSHTVLQVSRDDSVDVRVVTLLDVVVVIALIAALAVSAAYGGGYLARRRERTPT